MLVLDHDGEGEQPLTPLRKGIVMLNNKSLNEILTGIKMDGDTAEDYKLARMYKTSKEQDLNQINVADTFVLQDFEQFAHSLKKAGVGNFTLTSSSTDLIEFITAMLQAGWKMDGVLPLEFPGFLTASPKIAKDALQFVKN